MTKAKGTRKAWTNIMFIPEDYTVIVRDAHTGEVHLTLHTGDAEHTMEIVNAWTGNQWTTQIVSAEYTVEPKEGQQK